MEVLLLVQLTLNGSVTISAMNTTFKCIRCVLFILLTAVFASDNDINNVHATVNRELVGVDN